MGYTVLLLTSTFVLRGVNVAWCICKIIRGLFFSTNRVIRLKWE